MVEPDIRNIVVAGAGLMGAIIAQSFRSMMYIRHFTATVKPILNGHGRSWRTATEL